MTLTHHLILFAAKLSLGLAVTMSMTSARKVTSGFFRVHLWVILGLLVLAALAAYSLVAKSPEAMRVVWFAGAGAAAAYVGSVIWLYERAGAGRIFLIGVALLSAAVGVLLQQTTGDRSPLMRALLNLDFLSSGLLLGAVTTAMLLGHWYLNTPTMELAPLRRLILFLVAVLILRALLAGAGLGLLMSEREIRLADATFLALRWLSGLAAPLLLSKMTWETLKIPNTQSATGILYAGVILVFVGELVSQLLGSLWQIPV